jgi:hypothetical protein
MRDLLTPRINRIEKEKSLLYDLTIARVLKIQEEHGYDYDSDLNEFVDRDDFTVSNDLTQPVEESVKLLECLGLSMPEFPSRFSSEGILLEDQI